MGDLKSLTSLTRQILADARIWCRVSTHHDLKTIMDRIEDEGLSFYSITLPRFCQDFERSLASGGVSDASFLGFRRGRGALPLFLGGLLQNVFDAGSGRLLDEPCVQSIFFVRQICLLCKKILLPCSSERVRRAYDGYIKCEEEVKAFESSISDAAIEEFRASARTLFGSIGTDMDRKIYNWYHIPRHGPGATADRIRGNLKYDQRAWHHRLEEYFPSELFLLANQNYFGELDRVDFIEPGAEPPVRVITVPKTLKTPRIIAVEPTCMQYAQQSLLEIMVDAVNNSSDLSQVIGFTDQLPNQELARHASMNEDLATLDLSEASDRVSNRLVKVLFGDFPHLLGALQSCRSTRADVPGHGIQSLSKFASMGSAVCFPVEALVFTTVIAIGISRELRQPVYPNTLRNLGVRVYGDDIIVPVEYTQSVIKALCDFGFVINAHKSFWTGRFRESCGGDFYNGEDVTPTYLRRMLPQSRSDVHEVVSAVSFRNQLYARGLWGTVRWLDTYLGGLIPFPVVESTSAALGRHSVFPIKGERMCPRLHKPLVRAMVVRSESPPSKIDGHAALLKFFLKRGSSPHADVKHLERAGRPRTVDIKTRWVSAT